MRKYVVFIISMVIIALLVACKSSNGEADRNNNKISRGLNTVVKQQELFDPSNLGQPKVIALRKAFMDVVKKHKFPFVVGNIGSSWSEISNVEFSFPLEYDDIVKKQRLSVSVYALNGHVQNGFEVYLNPECSKDVIKNVIICSFMATNTKLDYKQAEKYFLEMTNNYGGEGRSRVITLNNYKAHISKNVPLKTGSGGYRGYPMLHIVSNEDVAIHNDTKQYGIVSEKVNLSDLIQITGIVINNNDKGYPSVLSVKDGSSVWGIYYDADKFNGYIDIGKPYVFYGQFAGKRDSFDYSLRLHRIDDVEMEKGKTNGSAGDKYVLADTSIADIKSNEPFNIGEFLDVNATLEDINVRFTKNYVDGNRLHLKVFTKNDSSKIFSGNVFTAFYSRDGKKRLGSDTIMVDKLYPGNETWANVTIDAYNGVPKMTVDFKEVKFTPFEKVNAEVNVEATQKTRNSFKWNFEGVSWYNDVKDITVYSNGTSVVVLKDNTKEQAQFYANTVWSCGNDYGVGTVQVIDKEGNILAVKGNGELIYTVPDVTNNLLNEEENRNSKLGKSSVEDFNQKPTFIGGTCLDIDYNDTGMPVKNVTVFKKKDLVMVAGRLEGVVGKNNLIIRWSLPNGVIEENKLYSIKNKETINLGSYIDNIGRGSVSIILDSTKETLATYYFDINDR